MEETNNMTAERSLEIITEQMELSRQAVAKDTGQALYASGLCTMAMAVVVGTTNYVVGMSLGNLLWLVLPFAIWFVLRNTYRNRVHPPVSFVASLVGKTWWTFAAFAIGFFIVAHLWEFIAIRTSPSSEIYVTQVVHVSPVIVLMMSMAVSITGHILKSKWLVWAGIIGGLVIATVLFAHLDTLIVRSCGASIQTMGRLQPSLYCLPIFLIALVGLVLPGRMLKCQ